jgi:hypothetical protein
MSAPIQPMNIQSACQVTHEVLTHMTRLFETTNDANGHKVANAEVLLSLKHTQLLIRPFLYLLQEQNRKAQGGAVLPSSLPVGEYFLPHRK